MCFLHLLSNEQKESLELLPLCSCYLDLFKPFIVASPFPYLLIKLLNPHLADLFGLSKHRYGEVEPGPRLALIQLLVHLHALVPRVADHPLHNAQVVIVIG